MMKEVFDLFPTLVMAFKDVIPSHEVNDIFKKLKEYKTNDSDAALVHGRSSFSTHKNILLSLDLEERMQEKVNEYTDYIKLKPLTITNSWFSIQNVGGMLKEHIHGTSVLSAALYINVDEKSSPLVFENPNPHARFNYEDICEERCLYTSPFRSLYPQKGTLVIFPSWLRHGSMYNSNLTPDRTVISFNAHGVY